MIIVEELGNIPAQATHYFQCRNCESSLIAETSDSEYTECRAHLWILHFKCPICCDINQVSVEKPGVRYERTETTGNIAEPKSGTTF